MMHLEDGEGVDVSAAVVEVMTAHALEAYPVECCGVLVGHGQELLHAVPAENIAEPDRRHNRYILDPLAIARADTAARSAGLDILGFYHSHPDQPATASATDTRAAWEAYVYLILSVRNGALADMTAWQRLTLHTPLERIPLRVRR